MNRSRDLKRDMGLLLIRPNLKATIGGRTVRDVARDVLKLSLTGLALIALG